MHTTVLEHSCVIKTLLIQNTEDTTFIYKYKQKKSFTKMLLLYKHQECIQRIMYKQKLLTKPSKNIKK